MKWLEIAWAQQGVCEVSGPEANLKILSYFQRVGRPDIRSDEIAWCAAAAGFCLIEAGISLDAIPAEDRLLARSYGVVGTRIEVLRVGALCIIKRGNDERFGHIGFVTGWTDSHVMLFGGNQRDSFCEARFPRAMIVDLRWPEPPVAPEEIAAASRTVQAAKRQEKDAAKVTAGLGIIEATRHLELPDMLPNLEPVAQNLSSLEASIKAISAFAVYSAHNWRFVLGALVLWWLIRMARDAGAIQWFRTEDRNTGAHVKS